jgi:hypothetical protein
MVGQGDIDPGQLQRFGTDTAKVGARLKASAGQDSNLQPRFYE